jgi:hypothetical protein
MSSSTKMPVLRGAWGDRDSESLAWVLLDSTVLFVLSTAVTSRERQHDGAQRE